MQNLTYKNFTDATPIDQNNKTGFVKLLANVYGIVDLAQDVVELGAFSDAKPKDVQIIDNHDYSSVTNLIAKTLDVYEVNRSGLPEQIREEYPSATGGLVLNVQFPMGVTKSREIFNAIVSGLVKEFSVGFNILKQRKQDVIVGGKSTPIRFISKGRLREVSTVLSGANQATQVLEIRSNKALEVKRKEYLQWLEHEKFKAMSPDVKQHWIREKHIDRMIELARERV